MVEDCARTKLAVVAADERDAGVRASLNLGHTLAHALESATGYSTFRHGEAVALGLLAALRISERELDLDPAVRSRVHELLAANSLPTSFEGPPTDELLEHMTRDKKRRGERRNLVLLRAPGDVAIGAEAGEDVLVRGDRRVARMTGTRNRIEVLHGVNLDMLGKRDAQHYGTLTLVELEVRIRHWSRQIGLDATFFHTNSEGEFVERLHQAPQVADGLVLNPGAWTHYSYAIRDALEIAGVPAIEVHLSDVDNARGVAASSRSSPTSWSGGSPARGRTATATRSSCWRANSGSSPRRRHERLGGSAPTAWRRSSQEQDLDLLLVSNLVNVRYLTGFSGTNGVGADRPGAPRLPDGLPLRRARPARDRRLRRRARAR